MKRILAGTAASLLMLFASTGHVMGAATRSGAAESPKAPSTKPAFAFVDVERDGCVFSQENPYSQISSGVVFTQDESDMIRFSKDDVLFAMHGSVMEIVNRAGRFTGTIENADNRLKDFLLLTLAPGLHDAALAAPGLREACRGLELAKYAI